MTIFGTPPADCMYILTYTHSGPLSTTCRVGFHIHSTNILRGQSSCFILCHTRFTEVHNCSSLIMNKYNINNTVHGIHHITINSYIPTIIKSLAERSIAVAVRGRRMHGFSPMYW